MRLTLYILVMVGTVNSTAAQIAADHDGGNDGYRVQCNSAAPQAAIIACTRIINDKREDSDGRLMALQNRGYYYQAIGDLDRSIADYISVLQIATGRTKSKILLNLGQLYAQQGDQSNALASYGEALSLDPKLASAYINRAALFIKLQNADQAIADLDRAVQLTPKDPEIYISRGSVFAHSGDQTDFIRYQHLVWKKMHDGRVPWRWPFGRTGISWCAKPGMTR